MLIASITHCHNLEPRTWLFCIYDSLVSGIYVIIAFLILQTFLKSLNSQTSKDSQYWVLTVYNEWYTLRKLQSEFLKIVSH